MSKSRPRFPLPLLLMLALAALLAAAGLTRGLDWDDDDSQYIMQAMSILEQRPQQFIEWNRFTMEQSSEPMGPIAYPWGLPLMLAPLYAVFGPNMLALKSINVVCFVLFLLTLWLGVRRHNSSAVALACVTLCALNPPMLVATDQILSDIPFLFVSTLCIVVIGIVVVERRQVVSPSCDHLLLGALAASAFLLRTNGILLLITILVAQIVSARLFGSAPREHDRSTSPASRRTRGRWRKIVTGTLPYSSFAGILLAVGAFLPAGGASHWDEFRRVTVSGVVRQLHYYIGLPSDFFEAVPLDEVLFGATLPLAVVGAATHIRVSYHVVPYILLTIFVYVLWPHREGLRFLFPLLPFYLWFVLASVDPPTASSTRAGHQRWQPALVLICVLGVLLWFGRASTIRVMDNLARNRETSDGPFFPTSREMFAFIRANTAPDSTIIFFKPRAMRLWTARNSIRITRVEQLERGNYLCLYRRTDGNEKFQLPLSDVERAVALGQLELVYQNTDFTVYRLTRAAPTSS